MLPAIKGQPRGWGGRDMTPANRAPGKEWIHRTQDRAPETQSKEDSPIKGTATDMRTGFSKEDAAMATRPVRCSVSLIIRETPVKTAWRCHLTPIRVAIANFHLFFLLLGIGPVASPHMLSKHLKSQLFLALPDPRPSFFFCSAGD